MLQNVFLCGLSFKRTMADDVDETPLGFLIHDIFHGIAYVKTTPDKKRNDFNSFYRFFIDKYNKLSASGATQIKLELHSVKVMFYLLLHEDTPIFIGTKLPTKSEINKHMFVNRFYRVNDLGMLVPKYIREMPNNKSEIDKFIDKSIDVYLLNLTEWKGKTGGRKTKRKK